MEDMHSLSDIRKLVEGEEECDIIMDEQTKHDPPGSGDPTEPQEPIPIEDNSECDSVRPSEEDDVGDIITARDVVNALYEPDEDVSVRVFPDRKSEDDFPGKIVPTKAAKLANIEDWLKSQNSLNRGVFFMVNKGVDNDESVTRINGQFVDMDNDSFEEQWRKVDAFPLPPSMVIQTSKSLHVYWFLRDTGEDAGLTLYRPIQIALVKHFDGDIKCQNESRVMRLPGYYHCKKDPVLVRCVRFHPERRYTQAEIASALPEYVEPGQKDEIKVLPADSDGRRGVHVVEAGCDFIQYCRDNASTLSEPLWYAMITNLAGFQGGKEAIHRLSEEYTEYTPDETDKKIEHYFKSKTRPMTCKTIAEAGYECPKRADGSCKCHSPAKRADEPLADDVLLDMINGLPVSADPLESLKSVKDFVEDYLYNVNPVNATALLSHPMKEHMRLTVADTRPLITYQKQLYKEHEKRIAEEKIQYQASILPDWYDFNLNGTLKFMPDILAKYMVEEKDVFFSAEEYRRYEDGVYQTISDLEAQNMVRDMMLLGETKLSQIKDAEGQWRMQCVKDLRELNPNPYVINLRNGLLNVLDNTMAAHTPKYLSTMQMDVSYDPAAKCPRFMEYLKETLPEDQIPLVQEMLGYFLVPVTRAQKCFVIVGEGGAGKSVLLHVIDKILLGEGNVSHVSWQSLNERFKPAELFGKLANVFADLPTKNLDDTGIFKALVGEDYLTVEKKNKNPFAFQSHARLIFSCNKIPRNYADRSEGFYRRLIIIRFDHAVDEAKKDTLLVERLQGEADGIFRYALVGLKRLIKNHFRFSETDANRLELQKYREESNSVLAFIRDRCEVGEDFSVGKTEMFNGYKQYCQDAEMRPLGKQNYNTELCNAVSVKDAKDSVGNRRVWKGIRLLPQADWQD